MEWLLQWWWERQVEAVDIYQTMFLIWAWIAILMLMSDIAELRKKLK